MNNFFGAVATEDLLLGGEKKCSTEELINGSGFSGNLICP
jgi:hypothetical protein